MTQVVKFYPKNAAQDPDNVLEQAIGQYDQVFIVGYDKDGNLDARASLGLKGADVLWLIEWFKHGLMNGDYAE
jgi:hypothetical protein